MPRPKKVRCIRCKPDATYFKPRGIPLIELEEIILSLDEIEAIRLSDFEGLYQEEAAARMKISRQTFGRVIESARKKVAEALVKGKALKIEGGKIEMLAQRKFRCSDCNHIWEMPYGTGRQVNCPSCESRNIHRSEDNRGFSEARGRGQRRECLGRQRKSLRCDSNAPK